MRRRIAAISCETSTRALKTRAAQLQFVQGADGSPARRRIQKVVIMTFRAAQIQRGSGGAFPPVHAVWPDCSRLKTLLHQQCYIEKLPQH